MNASAALPPLLGCLYCHSEGTTSLAESRKLLGWGSRYPVLRCSYCGSVADLDFGSGGDQSWRIRYRRVNRTSQYYYVALYLGKAGWLDAEPAVEISRHGYVQRRRVQQAREGDLSWLEPAPLRPPPPLMSADENVYLTLRAVSLQQTPPPGILVRSDQGDVLDSGKFYVTDQKLHLLGQRRDWSHRLNDIRKVDYTDEGWTIYLDLAGQLQQYHGLNIAGQADAQLVCTVVEALWRIKQWQTPAFEG